MFRLFIFIYLMSKFCHSVAVVLLLIAYLIQGVVPLFPCVLRDRVLVAIQ